MFNTIDYSPGRVTYDVLRYIDTSRSIAENLSDLDQDLLQVSYDAARVIDVGWYPSNKTNGMFVVQVIAHGEWFSPVFKGATRSYKRLYDYINQAIAFVRNFLEGVKKLSQTKRFVDLSDIPFDEGDVLCNKFLYLPDDIDCTTYSFEPELFRFDRELYSLIVEWKKNINDKMGFKTIATDPADGVIFCRWSYDLIRVKEHLKISAQLIRDSITNQKGKTND